MTSNMLKVLKFFGLFFGVFIGLVLLAYLSPIKKSYAKFFVGLSETTLSEIGDGVQVNYSFLDSKDYPEMDVECGLVSDVLIEKAKKKAKKKGKKEVSIQPLPYRFSSWARVLLPLLFFMALVIASPISWKRRGFSLLLGLFTYHLFALWFLRTKLLWRVQYEPSARVYDVESMAHQWIMGFNKYFPGSLDIFFLICLLLWLLFSFRRQDYKNFIASFK